MNIVQKSLFKGDGGSDAFFIIRHIKIKGRKKGERRQNRKSGEISHCEIS